MQKKLSREIGTSLLGGFSMRGINQVHYIGSVTQQPDMKYTPGGLAILEVTVAGKQQLITADGTFVLLRLLFLLP